MAGTPGHRFRLIVGVSEFSGLLSEMSAEFTVNELEDSVSLAEDTEWIPEQLTAVVTAGGRFTGVVGEVSEYIKRTLSESDFVAAAIDGELYDIGTFLKSARAVNASLGSRVNVNMGFRLSESDSGLARELFRQDVATTEASTTLTGDEIDLGAARANASRSMYLYYFLESGNVPPLQVVVKDSAASGGPFVNAHTFNLTASSINSSIAQRRPAVVEASYALDRYVQVDVIVSGANRAGEIVVLQSE